jgi:ribonucleoside-diphosphate reductase alpha chain
MAQFPNKMSEFVYVRSYARWLPELGRRETWEETVERVVSFLKEKRGELVPEKTFRKIRDYMLRFEVMPSMRLTWAAGPAVEKDNTCIFNCSFSKLDSVDSFAENLYILMCGTGFGFSVTKEAVDQLPEIPKIDQRNISYHTIEDSREGWADSVKMLMNALYDGKDVHFYYDQLRPEGARLATMGGKSSGPAPLVDLHSFIRETFVNAQGRKLKSIEAHDISNQIAEAVVMAECAVLVKYHSQISTMMK